MIKMWTCPFCGGKTRPVALEELPYSIREEIIREMLSKQNPIIVICTKCKRVWVDEP